MTYILSFCLSYLRSSAFICGMHALTELHSRE